MPDDAHEKTDEIVADLERKISDIYKQAEKDMREKWEKYLGNAAKRCEKLQKAYDDALKNGSPDDISKAKEALQAAQRSQTITDQRFQAMVSEMAYKYANANQISTDYANGRLPEVYAINYNFVGEKITDEAAKYVKGFSFTLVDESTVKYLAENREILLPKRTVDIPKDKQWNEKQINSQLMQGIIQGESIPKIANRLQNVTESTKVAAVRNARTMVTSAENKGRVDSAARGAEMGIIQKKRWISSNQLGRTRDWHMPDAFVSLVVDPDEPFVNDLGPIMYPGDFSADPANVWNCRCALAYDVVGFKRADGSIEYVK